MTVDLFDDGSSADLVANDGVYSRYFAGFDDDGRYTLKCQVFISNGALILFQIEMGLPLLPDLSYTVLS